MSSVPIIDLQLLPTPRRPQDIFRWGQENFRKLQDAYTSLLSYLTNQSFSFVPSGMIMVWSGDVVNIPPGWIICDGTLGTPDLRDKFIIGAGGSFDEDDTGTGINSYSLTAGSHTDPGITAGDQTLTPGSHTDPTLNETAEFTYYALAYVMKV